MSTVDLLETWLRLCSLNDADQMFPWDLTDLKRSKGSNGLELSVVCPIRAMFSIGKKETYVISYIWTGIFINIHTLSHIYNSFPPKTNEESFENQCSNRA